jgi:hypothetical protein
MPINSPNSNWVAVLTGDVVASSELDPERRARLPELLRQAGDSVKYQLEDAIPYPVDVFRGDSWQLVMFQPEKALRAALHLRALLLTAIEDEPLSTRVTIGIGSVDFIPADRVSSGDGQAFRLSGNALERLGRSQRMTVAMPDEADAYVGVGLQVICGLIDELVKRWTARQAQAVLGAMRGLTQQAIGAQWSPSPVSQQAIAQHLDGAGWGAIDEAIAYFERVVRSLSSRPD